MMILFSLMIIRGFDSVKWISGVESTKLFWTGGRMFEFHVRFWTSGDGERDKEELTFTVCFLVLYLMCLLCKNGRKVPGWLSQWSMQLYLRVMSSSPTWGVKLTFKMEEEWFHIGHKAGLKLYGNLCWSLVFIAPLEHSQNRFWIQVCGINQIIAAAATIITNMKFWGSFNCVI